MTRSRLDTVKIHRYQLAHWFYTRPYAWWVDRGWFGQCLVVCVLWFAFCTVALRALYPWLEGLVTS